MTDLLAAQEPDVSDFVETPEQRIVVTRSTALLSLANEGNCHNGYATPRKSPTWYERKWILASRGASRQSMASCHARIGCRTR